MKIQEAINSLKRKNGTLNTRFLSEKYIEEFGLKPEAEILLDNNIKNPQDIYNFENSTDDNCPGINGLKCPDSAKRRFINYKNGYVPQCKRCGNWRNQEKAMGTRFDKTNPKHVLEKYNIDVLQIKDSDPKYHSHFINIIKENMLLNMNGKIEGQRIDRNYFDDRGLLEAYNLLKKYNITNAEGLYRYETNDLGLCECGNNKRFINYNEGYKEYCEPCGRSKNNHMVNKVGSVDLELDEVLDYVTSTDSNKYSSAKILELSHYTINKIVERTNYLPNNASNSERLYHIEKDIQYVPLCLNCNNNKRVFISSIVGYRDSCSAECGYRLVDYDNRKRLSRESLYDYQFNRLSDLSNLGLCDEYSLNIFSKDDYVEGVCDLIFKHSCGHEYQRDISYQGAWHCPKCFPIRSKTQYMFFDYIKGLIPNEEVLYDDRKTLNGLELDIHVPQRKFAIEYDGIAFHSFGKSTHSPFNNYKDEPLNKNSHLIKTELCEDLDIQLFHIFSSDNQDIWNSMISNKLGLSRKIPGRKTIVKEVPNKDAKDFQIENHLQGFVNSSIKLGLYYEDELVSLMTFGKSRYTKTAEYELIRFCSLRNTTVQGGASKLLKHFEKTYNPKSIVSYANRRWSTGNLYNQLGFELSHVSPPNYFYFKLNENILHSRVKFQKHKLSGILDNFDPSKTESENLYDNNYRKIYDSGNLVYVKEFEK